MTSTPFDTAMRLRPVFLSALIFAVAGWYSFNNLISPPPCNIIVLTVESLRDDRIDKDMTPNLQVIGREGYRFANHRAISGWTGTNIVSILTGLSPYQTGVHTRGQSLEKERSTPLEKIQALNYKVEGIQGFMGMDIYKNLGLTIRPQIEDPLYWLALKARNRQPFFLWYHYLHTHLPYSGSAGFQTPVFADLQQRLLPSEQQKRLELVRDQSAVNFKDTTFLEDDIPFVHQLQESTIREFDNWFANFWDFFIKSGLRENTILVLTADHGDEHGEHGLVGHASTTQFGHLHEEIVRVPLFFWLPPEMTKSVSNVNTALASNHEDIMPSLFELLGIEADEQFKGRPIFHAPSPSRWKAMTSSGGFAEADPENIRYFEYAAIVGKHKLLLRIDSEGRESTRLYNLAADPKEKKDISSEQPELVQEITQILRPLIANRTRLPVMDIEKYSQIEGEKPSWIYPVEEKVYRYDDIPDTFVMEWSGSKEKNYIIEYEAGAGVSQITGTLEVEGNSKNFGKISRRYWQTWVVPRSPLRVRVKQAGNAPWSDWLKLEVLP